MKFICALIVVEDIQKARFLYETILGQCVKMDFGQNVTYHGDFSIHLKSHFESLIGTASISKRSNNFELYFEEDDLEPIVEKLKSNDIELVHDIMEQPWKQRVVRFYDYDNNMIEIGERLEHVAYRLSQQGLAVGEICKITYLPENVVLTAIEEYSKGTKS